MDESLIEQTNNRPWLYKKGQSGNPKGRPKGTFSMKEYIKKKLNAMSDEEREDFLEGIDKKVIWEMGEGKPDTKTDMNLGGPLTVQIINYGDNTNTPQLPSTN